MHCHFVCQSKKTINTANPGLYVNNGKCILSVAHGNMVLADHGRSIQSTLDPEVVTENSNYRPTLPNPDITFSQIADDNYLQQPANLSTQQDPHSALPQIYLTTQ